HPIDVHRRIWLDRDIGLMLGDPISVFDGLPPIAPIFVAGEQDEILDFWMSALDRLQAMPGQQGDGYSIIELSPKIIEHIKWVLDNRGNRASISSEELVDHIKLRYSSANMRR